MPLNVYEDIPYTTDAPLGKRKLADSQHLLLMQAALLPGQATPFHYADSHVHLLVVAGEIEVELAGEVTPAANGDLLPVAKDTYMQVRNSSNAQASFLIWKTPHPQAA